MTVHQGGLTFQEVTGGRRARTLIDLDRRKVRWQHRCWL